MNAETTVLLRIIMTLHAKPNCQFISLAGACNYDISHPPPPVISSSNTTLLDFRSAFAFKFILLALVFLLLPAGQVFAATINVDATCTLAQAINEANAATTGVGSCEAGTDGSGATGADTINITSDITLSAALPQIASTITINGNGNTLSGDGKYQIFYVRFGGDLTINNLIMTNGFDGGQGGAIFAQGDVTLNQVVIRNSRSTDEGGALFMSHSQADLVVNRSAFYGNRSVNKGGGAMLLNGKTHIITNSTFYNNSTGSGQFGAALYLSLSRPAATFTLDHVTITGNSGSVSALAVNRGSLTLRNSIIYGNAIPDCVRDVDNASVTVNSGNIHTLSAPAAAELVNCGTPFSTADPLLSSSATGSPPYFTIPANSPAVDGATCITGDNPITVDQRGTTRPQGSSCDIGAYEYVPPPKTDFTVSTYAELESAMTSASGNSEVATTINIIADITLSGYPVAITTAVTINGNGYTINGADTYYAFSVHAGGNLTLNRLIISNFSRAASGAGLQVAGTATLNQVVVRNSRTSVSGLHGGGIWVANGGTLNMSRSAVHGNTATQNGGGIAVAGGATVNITNSSIYDNTALSGGGMFIGQGGSANPTVTLRHVTITGNKHTGSSNRGGLRLNFGNAHLQNSIIYGNQGINCDAPNNSQATFDTLSGNIIGGAGNANQCTPDQLTSDPQLSSSATGSPPYFTIPAGSPAVNAATCISGITEDQRGVTRPQESSCDIGAFEYVPPPPPPPSKAEAPPATSTPLPCPSAPGAGAFGPIGSGAWRNHFARLGIQAANAAKQTEWARGDASVSGANVCLWEYECSTDGHWAYGHYHATHGHNYQAPGTRPPVAVNRSPGGAFNLCYSVWSGGCNSAEAWQFGHASGKQIYERWLYGRQLQAAPSGC